MDKVIEEFPNDTSSDMMENCVNRELDDNNQDDLSEENKTCLDFKKGIQINRDWKWRYDKQKYEWK